MSEKSKSKIIRLPRNGPKPGRSLNSAFMKEALATENVTKLKARTLVSPSILAVMIDWIVEQWLRFELRRQQWQVHCEQATLLSDSELQHYAGGNSFNLQFSKACKRELSRRQ